MTRAWIGIGSNQDDPPSQVRNALRALARAGSVTAASSLYRTQPWGVTAQPEFCNAVAEIETPLGPRELLAELKAIERELGRKDGARWGPRSIDLDILLMDGVSVNEPGLQVPHPRLYERAFVLAPLAELRPAFRAALQALEPSERAGVVLLEGGETVALMSDDALIDRVRTLAEAFVQTDLLRLRIEAENEDAVELRKPRSAPARRLPPPSEEDEMPVPARLDRIKADFVGILHLARPAVKEGEELHGDRELAHVEALGIRNAVRSLGAGRVASVRCKEGQAVEYGQVLFEIDRG